MSIVHLATVTTDKKTGKVVSTPVPPVAGTKQELQQQLKADKVKARDTKRALQEAIKNEKSDPKRYKRPTLASSGTLLVSLDGLDETPLNTCTTESWPIVKERACSIFDIDPEKYSMTFERQIPEEKRGRGNGKFEASRVGDMPFWGGRLILRALPVIAAAVPAAVPASSSSSSSSSSSEEADAS